MARHAIAERRHPIAARPWSRRIPPTFWARFRRWIAGFFADHRTDQEWWDDQW